MSTTLTKADATALWHAVDGLCDLVRAMREMPDMAQHLPSEEDRLKAAKAALRKVQAIVRQQRQARQRRSVDHSPTLAA